MLVDIECYMGVHMIYIILDVNLTFGLRDHLDRCITMLCSML